MVRGAIPALVLTLFLSATARGDPVGDTADRVLAALSSGDDAALETVANQSEPDPWLVADELCGRHRLDAARRYVARLIGRGADYAALPAYLDRWKAGEKESETRTLVARAASALARGDPATAREALPADDARTGTILAVRAASVRGGVLRAERRLEEAAKEFARAGGQAEQLGWLRRAGGLLARAVQCAYARSDMPGAVRWAAEHLRVERRRGDRYGEAAALVNLGGLREGMGQLREARACLEEATGILATLRDDDRAASAEAGALVNLARVHLGLGDYDRSLALGRRAVEKLETLDDERLAAWALANLGNTEWQRGEYRGALPPLERALVLMRARKERRGEARVLMLLGSTLLPMGRTEEARKAFEEALRVGKEAGARWAVAHALKGLGLLYTQVGSYSKALALQNEALELYRAIGDASSEVWLLVEMARVRLRLGEPAAARAAAKRASDLATRIRYRHGIAAALEQIAEHQSRGGEYGRALVALGRAREIFEEVGDRAGAARSLAGLGFTHLRRASYSEARTALDAALKIFREIGSVKGEEMALGSLGELHRTLGRHREAVACHEKCLEIATRAGSRAGEAAALQSLGRLHYGLGNIAQSLSLCERAMEVAGDSGDSRLRAELLTNVGFLLARTGEPEKARDHLRRALALRSATEDRLGTAQTRVKLGLICWEAGEPETARTHLEAALRDLDAMGVRDAASTRADLGVVLFVLGETDEAERLLREALRAQRDAGDRSSAVWCAVNLAVIDESRGRVDTAYGAFRDVVAEAERVHAPAALAQAHAGLARCALARGRPREAVGSARRGVALTHVLVRGFGDEHGSHFRSRYARRFRVYETGARAATKLGSARDLFFFLESGRAGTFLEAFGVWDRILRARIPEGLREEEANARAAEAVALERFRLALDAGEADLAPRRAYESARRRVREVVLRIQREAKVAAGVTHPEVASLPAVQESLRTGEALVVFGVFPAEVVALVATPGKARAVGLGDPAPILARCRRLLETCGERSGGLEPAAADVGASADPLGIAAELRRLVIEPLGLEPEDRRVIVSPAGALSYLPFSLLLPEREIVHVPSGTVHARLASESEHRGKGVLALGDPKAYGPNGRALALPNTRHEAAAVGDEVLLAEEATETAFWERIASRRRWRAVHLACHGFIDLERPTLSSLALTPDAKNDGRLTCLDIFARKVPADLVVLSACQTGKGRVYRAEGIVGLTASFFLAGTPRVLCSLWNVDDVATRALMTEFYRRWREEGISVAEALRQAQAHVRSREKWRAPYYWAGWVLWGRD